METAREMATKINQHMSDHGLMSILLVVLTEIRKRGLGTELMKALDAGG